MIETKTKTICGHQYEVTQFPAMIGLRKAIKLSKIIGPGIGKAVGDSGSIANIMDGEINIGDAVASLVDRLDEHSTTAFILELFSMTHRERKDLSADANFNEAFTGNYGEMVQALSFILEVNYGSFFGALTAATGSQAVREGGADTYRES